MGLRPNQIADQMGYTPGRIYQLMADPTFQSLVENYRGIEADVYEREREEYLGVIGRTRNLAARMRLEKLESMSIDDVSFKDLNTVIADSYDGSGYGKVSTTKIQNDLADALAIALAASSKVIEGRVIKDITPGDEDRVN